MSEPISPEALAALALARHVRDVALQTGEQINEHVHPATLDHWREMYACALTWATAPSDPGEDLDRTVYDISKNIAGNRWRSED